MLDRKILEKAHCLCLGRPIHGQYHEGSNILQNEAVVFVAAICSVGNFLVIMS